MLEDILLRLAAAAERQTIATERLAAAMERRSDALNIAAHAPSATIPSGNAIPANEGLTASHTRHKGDEFCC